MSNPVSPLVPDRSFELSRAYRQALVLTAGLWLLHTLAVWGYAPVFWGDYGRWLHEVERFAQGQVPYRDFQWHFPPLGIWAVGLPARVLGTDPSRISLITAAIGLATMLAFVRFVRGVAPAVLVPASVASCLLAFAYANRFGPPLPLGTFNPGGPLGMMCLLVAATAIVSLFEAPTRRRAMVAGTAAGLALLSKHDYWVAALYLVAVGGLIFRHLRVSYGLESEKGVRRSLVGSFAVTVLAGFLVVIAQGGLTALLGMITGFGYAGEVLARGLPSAERFTIELAASAALGLIGVTALWLSFALADGAAGRLFGGFLLVFFSACAVHVGQSFRIVRQLALDGPDRLPTPLQEALWPSVVAGRGALHAALGALDQRFQHHIFPAILPVLLILVLIALWSRWTEPRLRARALLLLGLCVALRVRRGWSGTDWFNILAEVPTYAVYLRMVAGTAAGQTQRTVSAAIGILLLVGVYAYYSLGVGPLTRHRWSATATARGNLHLSPDDAESYAAVATILRARDAAGQRPLYAFGPTGGWSYFLRRPNPWKVTRGFLFTDVDGGVAAPQIRGWQPPPFLLDNRQLIRPTIAPILTPFAWEPPLRLTLHAREDRFYFDRMIVGCTAVPAEPGEHPEIIIYDCALTPPDSSR